MEKAKKRLSLILLAIAVVYRTVREPYRVYSRSLWFKEMGYLSVVL